MMGMRGGGRVAPQHLADLQAVYFGQHQVEHDQAGEAERAFSQRLGAIGSGQDIKPRLLEVELQQLDRLRLVIHDQNRRSHTLLRYHNGWARTIRDNVTNELRA